jgi:phosphoglucosamine mutase
MIKRKNTSKTKKRKYFGTDGIRGRANIYPMTGETALKVGMAAGEYFTRGKHKHNVVIGKDTRLSGYLIEPSLTAGFISMGMNVFLVGPMPTPAISMLTRSMRCDVGVMISASHNSYEDNGIKLFDPNGEKLSDKNELKIEALMDKNHHSKLVDSAKLGRAKRIEDAAGRYLEFVKSTFPNALSLKNLKIVIDCANGAAYQVAPRVLWELGAKVISIGCNPDGTNINHKCGSTHPNLMSKMVKKHKADIGIALDGDADRCIICDENGNFIHGDKIIGLIAKRYLDQGNLTGNSIVGTQMTNKGLENYLNSLSLGLIRANVGDRYVVEEMRAKGCNIGGEQSGHIILGEHGSTGDGLVASLQVIASMVEKSIKVSKLMNIFSLLPQTTESIAYNSNNYKYKNSDQFIKNKIKIAESKLEDYEGRILLRASGTENKLRIMGESRNKSLLIKTLNTLKIEITNYINEQ